MHLVVMALVAVATANAPAMTFRPLFDGKSLDGWETWLGAPEGSPGPGPGLGKDPKGVFSVVTVDGAPAIRISGEMFGALTSKKVFRDFHLRVQTRWGEKRWPPREQAKRDSGVLYRAVGPHGKQNGYWMASLECQVQEHDTGDFWAVGGVVAEVEGVEVKASATDKLPAIAFTKGSPPVKIAFHEPHNRAIKSVDAEKDGQWNTVEVLCVRAMCVHAVNGHVNMVVKNPRAPRVGDEPGVPLREGRIQLQSEGAEVYYRNVEIRPLVEFPAAYAP